ncbi:MAG TPA: Mur ligase family protein [Labilithrix sp.]|nr:Mur ligase family protein [Labilithrix sp.]
MASALGALYARVPLGMRLGLEPMRDACARAGHPERAFECVHITGTNGKGSTCAMVESMARAARRKTGLYTSPHLVRFAERVRVDGAALNDAALAEVLEQALELGPDLSFFETATLAAFLAFRAAKVDVAVVEVGIGGRLDATNVIPAPTVTAITSVGLDHQDKLGDTLDAIAREKAAIAKPNVPMVLGRLDPIARVAAVDVAVANGARILDAGVLPPEVAVGLVGAHQRENARVAWTIGGVLGLHDDESARGLSEVRWPGRLERIEVGYGDFAGKWVLDGAHNPDGVRALVAALAREEVGAVVFGALAEKAWREMLGILKAVDVPRFYVAPEGREPAEPAELATLAPGAVVPSLVDALVAARSVARRSPVLVCGSLYLVGEARARLLRLQPDPIVAL